MYIKTGDKVQVITGKEKGKKGTVIKVLRNENRVVVEGLNMIKKHVKPSQINPEGGIVEREAAIHASNVMLIDPKTKKPTRIKIEVENGKKVRVAKTSGTKIDK